jgi:D-alanine-D-alanine ligase
LNIIVLTGGISSERIVALASGKGIAEALRASGHKVKVIDPVFGTSQPKEDEIFSSNPAIGKEFPTAVELKQFSNRKVIECINSSLFDNIDIVFLGLHGKFGEDGKVQSLLEMRGVNYTGSGATASAVAMDKDISKIVFGHYDIPTPRWFTLETVILSGGKNPIHQNRRHSMDEVDRKIKDSFGYPAVIKPNDEGSTVGLSIIQPDIEDVQLENALVAAGEYSDRIMVEEYISGRELTVAVLGAEALPVVEIKPIGGFYDYEHKYTKGKTEYISPADIPKSLAAELCRQSLLAHRSLGCKVYSRVDFRLNSAGEYSCLEVNTLPGMTELSLVPRAAKACNISFPDLLNKIIELSLE